MILWFDKTFEPLTTEDTAWAMTCDEAINGVAFGMPIDYIDTDDYDEAVKFFEWCDENRLLKYIKQVNIHGANINQEYKKRICEICNSDNIPVTFHVPNISQLKRANVPMQVNPLGIIT